LEKPVQALEGKMDWAPLIHLLTERPNSVFAQSHYMANFASDKLCKEAVKAFDDKFNVVTEAGSTISVRAI
jgi:hypothetical protein